MESILIVVDPELVGQRLEHDEDPLGELASRAPGMSLVFLRNPRLEETLDQSEEAGAVLEYYRKRTVTPRELPLDADSGERERELREAAMEAGRGLPLLEALIELAEVLGAPFVLTANQEFAFQPYEGGRLYDSWELVERLGELAAELDGAGDDRRESWLRHRLGRSMNTVEVHRATNEVQAKLLTGLLKQEDIPYYILSNYVPCFDGIFVAASGYWGSIHVLQEDAERARELIEGYIAARPDWDEVEGET